ncbi:MAG: dihydrofolate reductase family protein [Chloroflexota bacterium]|nr:dihydrofolate reductase family protein [Chloroflexota bacterium]
MQKIVAGLFISLDGVVEAPDTWQFPYFNDEMGAAVAAQMDAADTMLLGRRTYEEFARFWPNQSNDDPFAARMNNTPKVVVSTTLEAVTWQNSTLIRDNAVESLMQLKQQTGKQIGMTGSATLVRWLLRERLLDELWLLVHPIVIGSGKRLFPDGCERTPLKLASSQTFSTGVLSLVYQPAEMEQRP